MRFFYVAVKLHVIKIIVALDTLNTYNEGHCCLLRDFCHVCIYMTQDTEATLVNSSCQFVNFICQFITGLLYQ